LGKKSSVAFKLHTRSRVNNLSLVVGQKLTQQGMAGFTNFPATNNSVPFAVYMMLMKLGNLWSFNYINS